MVQTLPFPPHLSSQPLTIRSLCWRSFAGLTGGSVTTRGAGGPTGDRAGPTVVGSGGSQSPISGGTDYVASGCRACGV